MNDDPNHVHPHDCGYTVTGRICNCDCEPNKATLSKVDRNIIVGLLLLIVATALFLLNVGCASYTETMPDGTRRALHIVGTGKRSVTVEASKATWSHKDIPETLNAAGGAVGAGARAAAGVK